MNMAGLKHRKFLLVGVVALTSMLIVSIQACKPRKKDSSLQDGEVGEPQLFTGGACQTSGRWVDAAIAQAQQIKAVITQLRDAQGCKSLVDSIDQLVLNPESVGDGPGADPKGAVAQMFGIGREITAMSQYNRIQGKYNSASAEQKGDFANIDKMMTDRMFQMMGLQTQLAEAPDVAPPKNPSTATSSIIEASQVIDQVINLKARALKTAAAGLDVATTVFNNLGDDQNCPMKGPQVGTIAVAGAKLLGAYVGADAGLGSKAGSALTAYFKFLRNKKFNNALYSINQTEFMLSISCLVESTTTNYCSLRDAQYLLQDLIGKSGRLKPFWAREDNVPDMMTGFKVLNQDVPVVADWLRKVVTGVTPRRAADAAYYNSVMGSLNGLQQVLTTNLTSINQLITNRPPTDLAQRAAVFQLAVDIASAFQGYKIQDLPAFYDQVSPPLRQLFDILGIPFPAICDATKTKQADLLSPEQYLQAGNYAALSNPWVILRNMEGHVTGIFNQMSSAVAAYVRDNLNIDTPSVAADLVTPSASGNALERIQEIRHYLISLVARIRASQKAGTATQSDKSFVKIFVNTVTRIDHVVDVQREISKESDAGEDNLDKFLEEELAKPDLKLDGGSVVNPIVTLRAQAKERYTGAKATADDKLLVAALSEITSQELLCENKQKKCEPKDMKLVEVPLSDWMYDSIAVSKLAYAKITSMRNPRLKAEPPKTLALNDPATGTEPGKVESEKDSFARLLNTAFDEFDMLRFREAFFVNRIAKAVYWDLSTQLKAMQTEYVAAQKDPKALQAYKQKWSDTSIKLMTMADNFVVDRLNDLIPKDLQALVLDQSKATPLNFENLKALEIFKDPLIRHISGLKSVVEGRTSDWEIQRDVVKNTVWNPMRALVQTTIKDPKIRRVLERSNTSGGMAALSFATDLYIGPIDIHSFDTWAGLIGRKVRPDLYWSPYFWTDKIHYKDDEFGSLATLRGLLCLQSMALNNPVAYEAVCKGAYLRSVFERPAMNAGPADAVANAVLKNPGKTTLDPDSLSLSYDEWLAEYKRTLKLTDPKSIAFQGRRICAVYDHLRNNNVHMMKLRNVTDIQLSSTLDAAHK